MADDLIARDWSSVLDDIGNNAMGLVDPGTAGGRPWVDLDIDVCVRISRHVDVARRLVRSALRTARADALREAARVAEMEKARLKRIADVATVGYVLDEAVGGQGAANAISAAILALIDKPAAPPPAGGWLPIETAPKDGTEILAYYGPSSTQILDQSGGIRIARFDNACREPYKAIYYSPWLLRDGYCDRDPTHWQPLPPPPAATGEEG